MATTTNKQRVLTHLYGSVKTSPDDTETVSLPVLEQFIFGICREGTTRELAEQAFRSLKERFFDWNEVRVSSVRELEEALDPLPQPVARAERVISFLQEVFEATYSFDLELVAKKGVKQAAKSLARYQAASDFVVSWVLQQTLEGHAIPVDRPTARVAARLQLIDNADDDLETIRASLEHLVPKARGPLFTHHISVLAEEHCWKDNPDCPGCPMQRECPTGMDAVPASSGRSSRPKPR